MMTQANTHTHMKSQHDDGDDSDQSTNSTSKRKTENQHNKLKHDARKKVNKK